MDGAFSMVIADVRSRGTEGFAHFLDGVVFDEVLEIPLSLPKIFLAAFITLAPNVFCDVPFKESTKFVCRELSLNGFNAFNAPLCRVMARRVNHIGLRRRSH